MLETLVYIDLEAGPKSPANARIHRARGPRGKITPGGQEGTACLLLGAVQSLGGVVRVTMRVVAAESGLILFASEADGAEAGLDSVIDTAFAGLST